MTNLGQLLLKAATYTFPCPCEVLTWAWAELFLKSKTLHIHCWKVGGCDSGNYIFQESLNLDPWSRTSVIILAGLKGIHVGGYDLDSISLLYLPLSRPWPLEDTLQVIRRKRERKTNSSRIRAQSLPALLRDLTQKTVCSANPGAEIVLCTEMF